MRLTLAFVVALLFAPTISAGDWSQARDGLAVTIVRIEDGHVHVSWTAAPGDAVYEIYRGPTLDDLQLLTQTPTLAFNDYDAPDEDAWYVVVSNMPVTTAASQGPMHGKCLILRGLTGVSIHMASCVPMDWP